MKRDDAFGPDVPPALRPTTVIRHVHTCGTACVWQGKSLWCPACEVSVIDPVMLLKLETWNEPEPPEAA